MPTYEYKREDGSTFEVKQKMSEEPLKTCPDTGQAVKRVISGGGGVVYKGDGWYVTDYKDGGRKSASTPPAETEGSAKTEPKAEASKPEKSGKETSKE
ncbi:MAG: FmdB family transcriptional regulator [Balneola sp.]|jgi:putative FmdB family regulatory protein|nr:FmdB family transcriptional regulator [Balneola sp.]MBE78974.1 FmdB family transcriptional regulator [Balneola sp.]HBX66785.1 FmdB family transcriptional regulator [Balneolaceae bacterium]|tara:strand:- start:758 stop:1051 length:294 start_codon:yes stop_codon:yes gene_type:complete